MNPHAIDPGLTALETIAAAIEGCVAMMAASTPPGIERFTVTLPTQGATQ
ncbi:MAG: hypothetical protein ABR517_12965 [Thermoanaerobaculia bacterium]